MRVRWSSGAVVLAGLLVGLVGVTSAAATVLVISKPDFVAKANAICAAGSEKLDAAASKLGSDPSRKEIERFVATVYVPNIAGQLAKIRRLKFPSADKKQLTALFAKADKDLAKVKRDPTLVLDDPFADVNPDLMAYGLTECGSSDSGSGDPVTAIATALAGHYRGPWTNTTFGSTGTVDITISFDAATKTVKAVTMITGNVFGGAAPPPETITVPLDADPTAKVTVASTTFGELTFSIAADGSLVAEAPKLPSANAATFRLVLRPSATGADGTYTVGLRNGTTANGTVTLTRV